MSPVKRELVIVDLKGVLILLQSSWYWKSAEDLDKSRDVREH